MHDLTQIRHRAEALMATLGVAQTGRPLQDLGWTLRFDQAKRRLGLCRWKKRGKLVRTLSLSRHYAEQHGWSVMEDVVRHEIAHAIDFERRATSRHDAVWKRIARDVGADPTRIYEGVELDDPTSPYVGICPACDIQQPFYRRVRRIHACPHCCRKHNRGRFTERYRLLIVHRASGRIVQRTA